MLKARLGKRRVPRRCRTTPLTAQRSVLARLLVDENGDVMYDIDTSVTGIGNDKTRIYIQ